MPENLRINCATGFSSINFAIASNAPINFFTMPPITVPTVLPTPITASEKAVTPSLTAIQPCSRSNNTFCASTPIASPIALPTSETSAIKVLTGRNTILTAAAKASTVTAATFRVSLIIAPNSEPSPAKFVKAVPSLVSCP